MKRLAIFALAIFLTGAVLPSPAAAAETNIELNVGKEHVEGRVDVKPNPEKYPLSIGGGFIINNDNPDYWLGNINFSIQDEVFVPALSLGLGLKTVFGRTDFRTGDRDTFALPAEFLAGFDFRKTTSANIPISLFASLAYAPSALSFSDTDKYLEFYTSGSFHVNYYAAIYVGYRKLEIDYDAGGRKDELSDDRWFVGVRFNF